MPLFEQSINILIQDALIDSQIISHTLFLCADRFASQGFNLKTHFAPLPTKVAPTYQGGTTTSAIAAEHRDTTTDPRHEAKLDTHLRAGPINSLTTHPKIYFLMEFNIPFFSYDLRVREKESSNLFRGEKHKLSNLRCGSHATPRYTPASNPKQNPTYNRLHNRLTNTHRPNTTFSSQFQHPPIPTQPVSFRAH